MTTQKMIQQGLTIAYDAVLVSSALWMAIAFVARVRTQLAAGRLAQRCAELTAIEIAARDAELDRFIEGRLLQIDRQDASNLPIMGWQDPIDSTDSRDTIESDEGEMKTSIEILEFCSEKAVEDDDKVAAKAIAAESVIVILVEDVAAIESKSEPEPDYGSMTPKQLRDACQKVGIKWRNAHGKNKHLKVDNMRTQLKARQLQ